MPSRNTENDENSENQTQICFGEKILLPMAILICIGYSVSLSLSVTAHMKRRDDTGIPDWAGLSCIISITFILMFQIPFVCMFSILGIEPNSDLNFVMLSVVVRVVAFMFDLAYSIIIFALIGDLNEDDSEYSVSLAWAVSLLINCVLELFIVITIWKYFLWSSDSTPTPSLRVSESSDPHNEQEPLIVKDLVRDGVREALREISQQVLVRFKA